MVLFLLRCKAENAAECVCDHLVIGRMNDANGDPDKHRGVLDLDRLPCLNKSTIANHPINIFIWYFQPV